MRWLWLSVLLLTRLALAANPQDEQVVRTAYAKLSYAVQSRTVYVEARKNAKLSSSDLAQKLQDHELRFEIAEMSSGNLSDIASRPLSEFLTPPTIQGEFVTITHDTQTFDEDGKRFTSNFARPQWSNHGSANPGKEDWSTPVKDVMAQSQLGPKLSRYVSTTVTVRLEGKSRTYKTLWLFGSGAADTVAMDFVSGPWVRDFATESAYPSVLTDTRLRRHSAVNDWLNSTQRIDASCKTGKQDVCCDITTMHCGVSAEDLQSTTPAPSTQAVPKGGL